MAAHRRRLPAAAVARPGDADRVQVAVGLQQRCPRWLVLWSPWRRTFTGFACFTATPVIIDEPRADVFLARLREVERASTGPWPVRKVPLPTPARSLPELRPRGAMRSRPG